MLDAQVRDDSTETGWAWDIETDSGVVRAEHIVNCGGLWAREVGEMAGVHLPLLPMQHHCKPPALPTLCVWLPAAKPYYWPPTRRWLRQT